MLQRPKPNMGSLGSPLQVQVNGLNCLKRWKACAARSNLLGYSFQQAVFFFSPKQSFRALWHNTNPVQSLQNFKIAKMYMYIGTAIITLEIDHNITEHPFSCSFLDDCLSLFLASCLHVSWFSLTSCFFCRKWTYGWNLSGHHHITRYWLRTWTRHVQAYQRGNRHKYETISLIAL